ncbi:hypothetical protein [Natrinema versiforme]|uniref:DUF5658 domain-containing protein n=1 Tax=Natrinema versiforme JCM 10478 TaxID=1227496 RepID=L9Y438_9EURY|nr:hypothetical protein [Natrinema versiforme]ELY68849.1 hypothetical protein C489_05768 [Natrinema versiforme JCM 10478]
MKQALSAPIAAGFGLERRFVTAVHWPTVCWALAILTYGIGDAATTVYLVATTPLVEGNPLVAAVIGCLGVWAVVPLKVVALVAFYGLSRVVPPDWRVGVPIGLVLVGGVVTTWNLSVGFPGVPAF